LDKDHAMCPLTLEQKFPSILQHSQLSHKAQVDTRDDDEASDCWARTIPMCPLTLEQKFPSILQHLQLSYKALVGHVGIGGLPKVDIITAVIVWSATLLL